MRSSGGLRGAWLSCAIARAAAIISVGSPGIFRWSAAIQSLLPLRAQLGQDLTTESRANRTLEKKDAATEGCVTLKRGSSAEQLAELG